MSEESTNAVAQIVRRFACIAEKIADAKRALMRLKRLLRKEDKAKQQRTKSK